MRKIIYKLIHKLGFKIENLNRRNRIRNNFISQLGAVDTEGILLKSYDYIQLLQQKFPDLKIINLLEGYMVSFSNYVFTIESEEEFYILKEIYITDDYNFHLNADTVIIDIGANIGLASLYFANKENVKKVYSFEPVRTTCWQAQKNFELNPILSGKIEIKNIGLAGNNREDYFLFDRSRKGRTGVRGEYSMLYSASTLKEKVLLEDATLIITDIINRHSNYSIVIKMDCEGAEYEIFKNIDNSEIIRKVDIFMIEWHDNGSKIIEEILLKNNFTIFNGYLGDKSGMIYAVNRK